MDNIIGKGMSVKLNGFYFINGLGYYFSAGYWYCKKLSIPSNELDHTLYPV